MKALFDVTAEGGDREWSPPRFKDCAAVDIHAVFLNPDEHGEVRTIHYDGTVYEDITVIESGPEEGKRSSVVQMQSDFSQGLYKRTIILYVAEKDLGGNKPEQGSRLSMNDKQGGTFFHKYRVAESGTEAGMFRLTLEEIDE